MDQQSLQTDLKTGLIIIPELANSLTEEQKLNLANYDAPQRARIAQIASGVGQLDSNTVTGFGVEPQMKMNAYLDDLMKGLKTSEAGEAGAITLELARQLKNMRLEKMQVEAKGGDWVVNTFGQLPLIGEHVSALRYFQLKSADILKYLKEIEDRAQREIGKLSASNNTLDQLVDRTIENVQELELHLAAGQSVLMREKRRFIERREALKQSRDQTALMRLRDDVEQINAFETRLVRMHIGYTNALLSVPKIRLTQEAARIEMRNILDTILFDMPNLKSAILVVASLNRINAASKENNARRDITRQIGAIGSDLLDQAYVHAKESQGTGAEDVAMLAQTADKLLETISKGIRIDEENRRKRDEAIRTLGNVQTKLLDGVRSSANEIVARFA
jgi:uncharacterized protein YaaN involved in tellurite resistance